MSTPPVFIAGQWRASDSPVGTFHAQVPGTGEFLAPGYPISGFRDLESALRAGREAAREMLTSPPEAAAGFLETYAARIEERGDEIARLAAQETGLAEKPRLREIELPRTVDQLRQAAAAAREQSWRHAVIDTARNLRTRYGPLGGPVAVLGPNNFPLAFNAVSGGDFAAALAAGNPVIAKGHPGHPGTTRLLAEAASEALRASELPGAAVQMVYHMRSQDGFRLAVHPLLGALAFTGSRRSGLALKRAADVAGKPITLEMSGINPVVLLSGALKERGEAIAEELALSCTQGAGQFCTNPGLIVLKDDPEGALFMKGFAEKMRARPETCLLGRRVLDNLSGAIRRLVENGAAIVTGGRPCEGDGFRFANTILRVSAKIFQENADALQAEAFGPSTLLVLCRSPEQIKQVLEHLQGDLTASIYSDSRGGDDGLALEIQHILRTRVGRLLNDAMPTGVAVSPGMHHGGPFPCTGHPGFTSVGLPRAMLRFAALQGYDRVRPHRLPPELRDANPNGRMWRLIDGEWTKKDVPPAQEK